MTAWSTPTLFYSTTGGLRSVVDTDLVMFAIGRDPNTGGLGLDSAGVELGARGAVIVDSFSRSTVDSISAVGDVTDRVALTPVAIQEGAAFAETVFNGNPTPVDHRLIPSAVFSQPEIGTVGLTEKQALERYEKIRIGRTTFRALKNTLSGRDETTLMKFVIEADTDRILGIHLLGPGSAEMIQLAAIPLRMGARKADFDATMAVHPTAAEELVTMRETRIVTR